MKRKTLNIIEIMLVIIIIVVCIMSLCENQFILSNNTIFLISLLMPFSLLIILELITINKETKRKKMEDAMNLQLEELQSIDIKANLSKAIEDTIQTQIKEIQSAKRDFKKIDDLEKTIQVPLGEIQKQISDLNKKLSKEERREDKNIDDTVVLFTKDDIKEAIKKDLEFTKTVEKRNRTTKKSTKKANDKEQKVKKTTKTVEISKK